MFDRQVSTRGLAVCTALGTALSMSVGVVAVVPSIAPNVAPVAHAQTKVERNEDGYITTNVLESAKFVFEGRDVAPDDTSFWEQLIASSDGSYNQTGTIRRGYLNATTLNVTLRASSVLQSGDKVKLATSTMSITPGDVQVGDPGMLGKDGGVKFLNFMDGVYAVSPNGKKELVGKVRRTGDNEVEVVFGPNVMHLAANTTFELSIPVHSISLGSHLKGAEVSTVDRTLIDKYVYPKVANSHMVAVGLTQLFGGETYKFATRPYKNLAYYKYNEKYQPDGVRGLHYSVDVRPLRYDFLYNSLFDGKGFFNNW